MRTPSRAILALVLVLVLALPTVALAGGDDPTPAGASASQRVKIVDDRFRPGTITIARGTVVKWVNRGDNRHTTTSSTGLWDSGRFGSRGVVPAPVPPGGHLPVHVHGALRHERDHHRHLGTVNQARSTRHVHWGSIPDRPGRVQVPCRRAPIPRWMRGIPATAVREPLPGVPRRTVLKTGALGAAVLTAGTLPQIVTASPAAAAAGSFVSKDANLHLLRRATYGATPAAVKEIDRLGRAEWLERQLDPESISDPLMDDLLERFPRLDWSIRRRRATGLRLGPDVSTSAS